MKKNNDIITEREFLHLVWALLSVLKRVALLDEWDSVVEDYSDSKRITKWFEGGMKTFLLLSSFFFGVKCDFFVVLETMVCARLLILCAVAVLHIYGP